MKSLIVLLAPALACASGCCSHHNEPLHQLVTDERIEPAAVSGLPTGATSVSVYSALVKLDGSGHAAADQTGGSYGYLQVSTNPVGAGGGASFDLTALLHDLSALGTDLRSSDGVTTLLGKSYTLSGTASVGSNTSPASGSATVDMAIGGDETFALDLEVTIPTGASSPLLFSGVVGFEAQTTEVDVGSGDCS